MDKAQIGRVIKKARKENKVTLYAIEQKAGVQHTVVKSIEAGNRSYTIDSLLAVAGAVGVQVKCG